MTTKPQYADRFIDGKAIPAHTHDALVRYIERGLPVGHFLTAVLCNDLRGAVSHADDENARALYDIVKWIWNRAPSLCWGDTESVADWCKNGGLLDRGVHAQD